MTSTARAAIRRIANAPGDAAGARERAILNSPFAFAFRSGEFPGCVKVKSPEGSFVYRVADRTIVG